MVIDGCKSLIIRCHFVQDLRNIGKFVQIKGEEKLHIDVIVERRMLSSQGIERG